MTNTLFNRFVNLTMYPSSLVISDISKSRQPDCICTISARNKRNTAINNRFWDVETQPERVSRIVKLTAKDSILKLRLLSSPIKRILIYYDMSKEMPQLFVPKSEKINNK